MRVFCLQNPFWETQGGVRGNFFVLRPLPGSPKEGSAGIFCLQILLQEPLGILNRRTANKLFTVSPFLRHLRDLRAFFARRSPFRDPEEGSEGTCLSSEPSLAAPREDLRAIFACRSPFRNPKEGPQQARREQICSR